MYEVRARIATAVQWSIFRTREPKKEFRELQEFEERIWASESALLLLTPLLELLELLFYRTVCLIY
jgi:hypothetical protein